MHTVCLCTLCFFTFSGVVKTVMNAWRSGIMVSDLNTGNPEEDTQPLAQSQNAPIVESRGTIMSPSINSRKKDQKVQLPLTHVHTLTRLIQMEQSACCFYECFDLIETDRNNHCGLTWLKACYTTIQIYSNTNHTH